MLSEIIWRSIIGGERTGVRNEDERCIQGWSAKFNL
jgi:hypothetical protein